MTTDEVIKRLESEYHLDEDHGWKILLKRLEKLQTPLREEAERRKAMGDSFQCSCWMCKLLCVALEDK